MFSPIFCYRDYTTPTHIHDFFLSKEVCTKSMFLKMSCVFSKIYAYRFFLFAKTSVGFRVLPLKVRVSDFGLGFGFWGWVCMWWAYFCGMMCIFLSLYGGFYEWVALYFLSCTIRIADTLLSGAIHLDFRLMLRKMILEIFPEKLVKKNSLCLHWSCVTMSVYLL